MIIHHSRHRPRVKTLYSRSFFSFTTCVLSYIWRTGAQNEPDSGGLSWPLILAPRIAITLVFSIGFFSLVPMLWTLSRYSPRSILTTSTTPQRSKNIELPPVKQSLGSRHRSAQSAPSRLVDDANVGRNGYLLNEEDLGFVNAPPLKRTAEMQEMSEARGHRGRRSRLRGVSLDRLY